MIIRAALSLGLVWLSMPHHPDIGLAVPVPAMCNVTGLCADGQGSTNEREAVFKRLREVRADLRDSEKAKYRLRAVAGGKTWNKI